MDLTALPTQSTTATANDNDISHDVVLESIVDKNVVKSQISALDPNALILADVLTDATISWRIHNCKVSERIVTQDLPMQFLYHYDSLDDAIKKANSLSAKLLSQFNTVMTASEAAALLGIDNELMVSPWHVKVTGSLVVFSEALQLAVRLHWTNTGKATQQLYTQHKADAIVAAFEEWHFFGRVDVLYKNSQKTLISIDEENIDKDTFITFAASSDYQYLPSTHALTVIAQLEAHKSELPWFTTAILERVE